MRQEFVVPFGSDLVAAGLPAGQIATAYIDNKSGSWLQLFPSYDFIPPYTIGFRRTFAGTLASIDVRFTAGPGGEVSTEAGDPPLVILDSDPQGEIGVDPGRPYIERFTPTGGILFDDLLVPFSSGLVQPLYQPPATKRLRVLSLSIAYSGLNTGESPVTFWFVSQPSAFTYLASGMISPDHPTMFFDYAAGVDLPLGEQLEAQLSPYWADARVAISASLQEI
jgi:hypothetical protein